MGRLTAYRTRLDTTTSWAITTSALVATFAFGSSDVSHIAFLFLMGLVYFFLHLEARRYVAYESSRYRVLLLEQSFFPEVIGAPVNPNWTRELLDSLCRPGIDANPLGAHGWRLRRNYIWIYGGILLTWIAKLDISGPPTFDPLELVSRAAVGSIPGIVVWALVVIFYIWLVVLTINAHRFYPGGDERVRRTMEMTTE
jgi:uncharacterized membrane protein